jgi:pimeloyl-ACP methyl ester carboxylesterase
MGGVVARAWWVKDNTASKLHRLITIGSPHQGTLLARLGWGKNAAQMRSKSAWLAGLSVQETPAHKRRTLCFYGDCDNVVIPSANATLPGSARQQLPGAGHLAMLDHPVLFAAVLHSLREST